MRNFRQNNRYLFVDYNDPTKSKFITSWRDAETRLDMKRSAFNALLKGGDRKPLNWNHCSMTRINKAIK